MVLLMYVTLRAGSPGVQTGAARRHPLYSGERQRTRGAERSAGPHGSGPRAAVRAVGTRSAQLCEFWKICNQTTVGWLPLWYRQTPEA